MRLLYRLLTDLAGLPLRGWLGLRARRGKEIPARLNERRGLTAIVRTHGQLAWFHGASMGEALSLLPLINEVRAAGWQVLLTTGTVTSAALMAERLPAGCIHQFVPLDRLKWIRRFLDHWRPGLVLWTESDLWPNTLMEIGRRQVPLVLLNARLSDRALRGWQRWPGFARDVMTPFTLVLAQSAVDAQRFQILGASNVRAQGNLKLAAPPLPVEPALLAGLRTEIKGRPVWLAASIHPGEDAIAAAVARTLKPRFPGLLTLIVPRHAEKGRAMAEAMTGLRAALRSETKTIGADVDVYIADTMGELGLFFRLSEIVFMGKSLAMGGGQNPAEPALIGCALILGSDMSNFREITAALVQAGAAVQVDDAAGLTEAVASLLGDADRRSRMIGAGQGVMRHHANAVKDTLAALAPYLAASKIQ